MKKQSYNIKICRAEGFKFEGTEYLNPDDTSEQKDQKIQEIREKYNICSGEMLNISNFSDVYC